MVDIWGFESEIRILGIKVGLVSGTKVQVSHSGELHVYSHESLEKRFGNKQIICSQ